MFFFYVNNYFKIIIGVIVDFASLIPSLLLVQFFRRIRARQKPISLLRQTLCKINPHLEISDINQKQETKGQFSISFPWWCIFIAYSICGILVGISILFIIARGIEFGDLKTEKWLASILSGFFSSILLTQPVKVLFFFSLILLYNMFSLKILCLAIVFTFFCRETNDDNEANEYLDENKIDLDNNDKDYLPPIKVCSCLINENTRIFYFRDIF